MPISKGQTFKFKTVSVLSSQTPIRPDGTTALLLGAKELGSIAFQVDLPAIGLLRRQLADAETMLRSPKGRA